MGETSDSKIDIKECDMGESEQFICLDIVKTAQKLYELDKDVAAFCKEELDKRFGPTWHVIVGKSFGSRINPSNHFTRMTEKENFMAIGMDNENEYEESMALIGPPPAYLDANSDPNFPGSTVITVQPNYIISQPLDIKPCLLRCPNCLQITTTEVTYFSRFFAWLLCKVFFAFGCWLCCCIPFCCKECKEVEHRCRNCKHLIGTYKRL
ncbi:unnamed protein product, partial [Mesorhabditis belari]|uniref:LITAF domain-containing protein n=1 Tax=Mesorhabditis belari TaxID=2138241 RepID=A0AAF3EKI5_9BILA